MDAEQQIRLAKRWMVVCPDHRSEKLTRAAAERRKEQIEALGACRNQHTIEEAKP